MQRELLLTVKRQALLKYILCCCLGFLASMFGFQEMPELTGTPAADLRWRVWRGSSEHLSLVQVLFWTMTEECFSFQV